MLEMGPNVPGLFGSSNVHRPDRNPGSRSATPGPRVGGLSDTSPTEGVVADLLGRDRSSGLLGSPFLTRRKRLLEFRCDSFDIRIPSFGKDGFLALFERSPNFVDLIPVSGIRSFAGRSPGFVGKRRHCRQVIQDRGGLRTSECFTGQSLGVTSKRRSL